jgi:thiol-disulfide isomerase/thioredoxin
MGFWHRVQRVLLSRLTPGALVAAIALAAAARVSADPLVRPDVPAATQPTERRSLEQVAADLNAAGREVSQYVSNVGVLFDPALRQKAGPKALPVMKRMGTLIDEVVAVEPEAKEKMGLVKLELEAMMALLGDADAVANIKKTALSTDADEAARGKAWELALAWAAAGNDPLAQEKLVTELGRLGRSNHKQDMVAQVADLLSQSTENPALIQRIEKVITDDLDGPLALRMKQDVVARQKLRGLLNNELVLKGPKVDGGTLSTAEWKGRVVLVDFWATWCPPCVSSLPRLKKLYAQHHDKGFEILGISSDENAESLKEFLADQKDMPWPHLFDAEEPGPHALARRHGVQQLPTWFLIDRKGKVRSVKAHEENLEELIPKLLAEQP